MTETPVEVTTGAFDSATISWGSVSWLTSDADPWFRSPNTSIRAGPTVSVRVLPSMPAGIEGSVLPCAAAAACAFAALKVNVATASGTTT